MNQLTIKNVNGKLLADSREVSLMIGKRHDHLLRDIDGYCQILKKSTDPKIGVSDFFETSFYQDGTGRVLRKYDLTRKGCEMVANKMTGEKGVLFTATYVTRFEEMEHQLSEPYIPKTLHEALRFAADLAEKNETLLLQAATNQPKVLFADAVATSKTSILVGELAKILKQNGISTGPNRLFVWLRDNGYLISRRGTDYNMPTQRSMELGLFEIKETSISHSDGHVTINKTPKVTGKGQVYFINKFKNGNGEAIV